MRYPEGIDFGCSPGKGRRKRQLARHQNPGVLDRRSPEPYELTRSGESGLGYYFDLTSESARRWCRSASQGDPGSFWPVESRAYESYTAIPLKYLASGKLKAQDERSTKKEQYPGVRDQAIKALPVMVRIHLVDEYGAVLSAVTGCLQGQNECGVTHHLELAISDARALEYSNA